MSVGKHGFDESAQGRRRNWVGGGPTINVSMILLPFNGPTLSNNLTRAMRFPSIGEPTFVLFEYRGQVIRDGTEREGGMRPRAARDAVGHTQVTPFEEEQ